MGIDKQWFEYFGVGMLVSAGIVLIVAGKHDINTVCTGLGMIGFGLYLLGNMYF